MNINEFIPPNTVRLRIAEKCDDREFRRQQRSWYTQSIRDGLDLLAMETFFDKGRFHDVVMPANNIIQLPKDIYSIANIYVYNGECRPENSINVYWKAGFNNLPDGQAYTAPRNEFNSAWEDPFRPGMFGLQSSALSTTVPAASTASRWNYDVDLGTTAPIKNIKITKNTQVIDSAYLTLEADVDNFMMNLGWVKHGSYKYKITASPDTYAATLTITYTNLTEAAIAINSYGYTNQVGPQSINADGGLLGVKWANVMQSSNGLVLMLSQGCTGMQKVRIEYTGTFGSFDEVPCIPRIIRDAVEDYGCREYGSSLITQGDPLGKNIYALYHDKFENPRTGSFYRAQDRVNNLSEWERKCWNIYLSKGTWLPGV